MKTKKLTKLTHFQIIDLLKSKTINWSPLQVAICQELQGYNTGSDINIEICLPDGQFYRFLAEVMPLATPRNLNLAIQELRKIISNRGNDWYPMIIAPFLSPERLDELQKVEISGLDLSGNCVVNLPGRLFVFRTGKANSYPQSSTLVNPYTGRSSLVCRMFFLHPEWKSLKSMVQTINEKNGNISMGQASKALDILCEELLVAKNPGCIKIVEAQRLLDNLVQNYKTPKSLSVQSLKLETGLIWQERLNRGGLRWAVSGVTSARHYSSLGESGPMRVYVSDLRKALENLGGAPEKISHFADLELIYTDDPCVYFDARPEIDGIVWASKIQTFLELIKGDARQREVAQSLRKQILLEHYDKNII
ncbi:MAG: hypothetical protein WCP55_16635 [Lentisphaerota bacterium]